GNKMLEPLKYTKVAVAASVSRQKVESGIAGTTSLLSYCLEKGENIALKLKDVGVLVIEGTKVQMWFYRDFLDTLLGKENVKNVVSKVPQLLSHRVPIASLTSSRRIIIFPEFEQALAPRPLPRDSLRA
ncbi:CCD81 protein, partial [Upupa epops]|nr:CCD81 protein [Upupa epops]